MNEPPAATPDPPDPAAGPAPSNPLPLGSGQGEGQTPASYGTPSPQPSLQGGSGSGAPGRNLDYDERLRRRKVCAYCGAPLDPRFYFCTACATPYQDEENVLPQVRPTRLTDGMLIAKKAPGVWPLFWTYVAVILGSAIFSQLCLSEREDLALFVGSLAILITTCIFAALHWPSLAVQLRRPGFLCFEAWGALLLLAPLLILNYYFSNWLRDQLGQGGQKTLHELLAGLGLTEPAMILLICILPAFTEEIAFRGLVQHWLQTAIKPLKALVLASALFTALHFNIILFPYLFLVGMLLGWTRQRTGSLYPSILIHFLHNLAVLEWLDR